MLTCSSHECRSGRESSQCSMKGQRGARPGGLHTANGKPGGLGVMGEGALFAEGPAGGFPWHCTRSPTALIFSGSRIFPKEADVYIFCSSRF